MRLRPSSTWTFAFPLNCTTCSILSFITSKIKDEILMPWKRNFYKSFVCLPVSWSVCRPSICLWIHISGKLLQKKNLILPSSAKAQPPTRCSDGFNFRKSTKTTFLKSWIRDLRRFGENFWFPQYRPNFWDIEPKFFFCCLIILYILGSYHAF